MKSSAISRYSSRHADTLDPEKKQMLAQLPDNAVELVHAAFFDDADMPSPPDDIENLPDYGVRLCDRMRRNVPALNSLSDEELYLALGVAQQMEWDAMTAEEYLAEAHEHMTAEECERMSDIARGVGQPRAGHG
jgi:hypothetical protein